MTTVTPDTDVAVLDRMLGSIEAGDIDALRTCYTPDAVVWHAHDEVEQDVDTFTAVLAGLCAVSTRRSYEHRRRTVVGRVAFLQHVLTADLVSGDTFRLPAMMRVEINEDGLVFRIEEYFDSRPLASLAAAAG
jgi:ketosteroid isomerase-like protein